MAEAENPPQQPREWAQKLDITEAIAERNNAIRNDPQIIAHAQRELARIDRELETVNAQIATLEQRRRDLVDQKRPYLFG